MSASRQQQHGAALAIALLMLLIITLLGVAAVRATQVELRLTQNAESRMAAIQSADSMVSLVLMNDANVPVNEDASFKACIVPGAVRSDLASCTGFTSTVTLPASNRNLADFGYAKVERQLPLFVDVNVLREAMNSARTYDFARYNITGGFDRSSSGNSAAEVIQGTLVLHVKPVGTTYEPAAP